MSLLDVASLIVTPNGYKEGKLYSVVPSSGAGDLDVTRATTATRVNADGLVELVPYNLLTWSEAFDNADWLKFGSITANANATTSPNGIASADSLIPQAVNGTFAVAQPYAKSTEPTSYTFSGYAKSFGYDFLILRIDQGDSNGVKVAFNINTGIISTAGATNGSGWVFGSANIVDAQNGWYRFSISFTTGSNTYLRPIVYVSNATGDGFSPPSYTANGTSGVYIWGAQLVEGTEAKPYLQTTTRLDIPRLDYSNGSCPSILVEPQRTNQYLKSNDFANWSNNNGTNTITPNYAISPDGIMNASRWVATGTGYRYNLYGLFTLGTTTVSIYAKRNNSGTQKFGFFINGSGVVDYELNLTNEWQRFTYTFNLTNEYQGLSAEVGADVSIYGYQLEAGSYATSYIPTTSASVTRNADVISKTGISSLIGQTEGTIFIDLDLNNFASQTNSPVLFSLFGNATIYMQMFTSGYAELIYSTGAGTQAYLYWSSVTNGQHKIAFGYKANDFVLYIDGLQIATDASGSVDTLSSFYFGYNNSSFNPTANYKAAALWKTRLTNSQLSQLTTI